MRLAGLGDAKVPQPASAAASMAAHADTPEGANDAKAQIPPPGGTPLRFEVVEVNEQDRDHRLLPTHKPGQGMVDPIVEKTSIGQARQRVVECPLPELRVQAPWGTRLSRSQYSPSWPTARQTARCPRA
jgi:hypothetical protein